MTARTRTAEATDTTPAPAPAKKTTAKKTTAKRTTAAGPARKRTPRKQGTADRPLLSLVKSRKPLPTRAADFMTDTQGYATLAGRMVGITTVNIRDWRDHRDGTATRRLRDGSTLHYNLKTRTLTWQAVCPMGAIHAYTLTSPSAAAAARVHADLCTRPHADLSTIPALTADELEALGLLQTPTWARPDLLGDAITETIPVPLPEPERTLADTLVHSKTGTADTQPLSTDAIAAHIAAQLADDTAKEHPQP
jgi:hypothetical protein